MPSQPRRPVVARDDRLLLDIETSPNEGTFWRCGYKLTIPYGNVRKERQIICAAWKWESQKTVHAAEWTQLSDGTRTDEGLLNILIPALDKAGEIVAHNGDKFDMRWIRGRALKHGIPMSPHYVTVDTFLHAKRLFDLNSYRLAYLAKYLDVPQGHKMDMVYQDWLDVMDGDDAALRKMLRYCRQDVRVLEGVFQKMSPYMRVTSPIMENLTRCAECGSEELFENQRRLSGAGYWRVQIRCRACGKCRTLPTSRWDRANRA